MRIRSLAAVALLMLGGAAPQPAETWTTLGTAGGPVVFAERSQPANLLRAGDLTVVVDCGDGCTERLAGAGVTAGGVDAVFVSHLHQDHVAGLAGLIALHWMQASPKRLAVYGPPGIEAVVAGIVASLGPSQRVGLPIGGRAAPDPAGTVAATTVADGADLRLGAIRVRAVRNSHFDENGAPADNGTQSLSYRFDLPGGAIGYTGDTGPSEAVARLFGGVDLVVSEVADLAAATAAINAPGSAVPLPARAGLIRHIAEHHLTPEQAGSLAAAAGARCLALTHLSISRPTAQAAPALERGARSTFRGAVAVAHDGDRFGTTAVTCPLR